MVNPTLYRIGAGDIIQSEQDGDMRVNAQALLQSQQTVFTYDQAVLAQYISLKYLRQGFVVDGFNETVGRVHALIYQNNQLQTVHIALDDAMALPADRLHEYPADTVGFLRGDGHFNVVLSVEQTQNLAMAIHTH